MPTKKLINHNNLKAFKQLGFEPEHDAGKDHVLGDCPFCGDEGEFHVNVVHKAWDCKNCGKSGGYQTFLQDMVEQCQKAFRSGPAVALARNRGLKSLTLKRHGVGYNYLNETFLVPVWDANRENLWNIRVYSGKRLYNLAGCQNGLFGWDRIERDHEVVWLCEGEWDCMAMDEVLRRLGKQKTEVAVGVPGAGTFPLDWSPYFQDKEVRVVYDNDYDREKEDGEIIKGAGKAGAAKVYNALLPIANELKFVHWPSKWKNGFDLRDYYVGKKDKSAKRTYSGLMKLMAKQPKDYEEANALPEMERAKTTFKGKGKTARQVYEGYRKWLKLPDTSVLDVLFGTIIGNRLTGDPLWLFLVGPSGSAKTELIMSFNDAPNIVHISSLTSNTLISGSIAQGGGDPSLIPKLDGKSLTIKDVTSLLEMNPKVRDDIFGQLRDVYDGEAAKPFGTGAMKKYKSKFGIIAGVTPAIELYTEGYTALGERFLRYPVPIARSADGKMRIAHRAIFNLKHGDKEKMRQELRDLAKATLDRDFGKMPVLTVEMEERLVHMAYWTSIVRGSVTRDKYTKEVLYHPFVELPTRLSLQYCKLAMGIAQFRRIPEIGEKEFRLIRRLALGTVPMRHKVLVRKMWMAGKDDLYTVKDLSELLGLPLATTRNMAGNLEMLKVLRRERSSRIDMLNSYGFTEEFIDITQKARVL